MTLTSPPSPVSSFFSAVTPRAMSLFTMIRNRLFLLLLLFLIFFSSLFFLSANGPQRSRINSLVTETQQQINNLKKNFKDERLLEVGYKYLEELGLTRNNNIPLWPKSPWRQLKNATEPVILSAVQNGHAGEAVHFLRNAQLFLPNLTVILYDLGLSSHEVKLVEQYCNSSLCTLKQFESAKYPSHVRNFKTNAYRPILIQHTLKDAGCVLWLNIDQRFTTDNLSPFLSLAKSKSGVIVWLMEDRMVPTSSMTHPKMFTKLGIYDDTDLEEYNFQHMADLRAMVVYNVRDVHEKLMTPWVKCALLEDCVEPIGAQSSGCRFDKKPRYRYSGCHGYDVSALNVVLGQMFQFDESAYFARDRFFVRMNEEAEEEEEEEEKNKELNATLAAESSEPSFGKG